MHFPSYLEGGDVLIEPPDLLHVSLPLGPQVFELLFVDVVGRWDKRKGEKRT